MADDLQTILEQLGDPAEVARELEEFSRSTRILSDEYPQLVARYPDQWIAMLGGQVRAHGPTLQDVLEKLDQEGLPGQHTVVRFMDTQDRLMIL